MGCRSFPALLVYRNGFGADPRFGAGGRILFWPESVRHHRDLGPAATIWHHSFAGIAAGVVASVGSGNRHRAVCHRISCRQEIRWHTARWRFPEPTDATTPAAMPANE